MRTSAGSRLATEHTVKVVLDDGSQHPSFGSPLGWVAMCSCRWVATQMPGEEAAMKSGRLHVEAMALVRGHVWCAQPDCDFHGTPESVTAHQAGVGHVRETKA